MPRNRVSLPRRILYVILAAYAMVGLFGLPVQFLSLFFVSKETMGTEWFQLLGYFFLFGMVVAFGFGISQVVDGPEDL